MAKNNENLFVQLTVDGKNLEGGSLETGYERWFETSEWSGLQMYSGDEGPVFDTNYLSLTVSKGIGSFIECFYKRGYNELKVTVVRRSSNEFSESCETLKVVYSWVEIKHISLNDNNFHFAFDPRDTIEVTMNVINDKNEGIEKVGPITYSIPKKKIV